MTVSDTRHQLIARMKEDNALRSTVFAKAGLKQTGRHEGREVGSGDIAIIGMSCRFPGSTGPEQYFDSLLSDKDLLSDVPEHRWSGLEGQPLKLGRAGVMSDILSFNNELFGISLPEAQAMDPHQRLLLEEAWLAIEDAGYAPEDFKRRNTGVFVAMYNQDFVSYANSTAWDEMSRVYLATGSAHSLVPNRISFLFDLRGPSEVVDTACSSALVAVHRAIRSIHEGECEQAVVGGVNLLLGPSRFQMLQHMGLLSSAGRCAPFDANGDGQVPGEGAAALVLKPLSAAIRDLDNIRAVLVASGVGHQGKQSKSLTLPSYRAQAELMENIYSRHNLSPNAVSYIEGHGNGGVGDRAELLAFQKVFESGIRIGSVKGHIGFLEAVGGLSQIVKVVVGLERGVIPGTRHHQSPLRCDELNPDSFHVITRNTPLSEINRHSHMPFVAAINSYGLGGVNAHLVVKEYRRETSASSTPWTPIFLSAASENDLRNAAGALAMWITKYGTDVNDVALTLAVGRVLRPCRVALLVHSKAELLTALSAIYDGEPLQPGMPNHDAAASNHLFQLHYINWLKGDTEGIVNMLSGARRVTLPRSPLGGRCFPLPLLRQANSAKLDTIHYGDPAIETIDGFVYDWLARQTGLAASAIRSDALLGHLGIDSVAIVSLCEFINRRASTSLIPTQITEQTTVGGLADAVCEACGNVNSSPGATPTEHLLTRSRDSSSAIDVSRIISLEERDRLFRREHDELLSRLKPVDDSDLAIVCSRYRDHFDVQVDAQHGIWLFLHVNNGNIFDVPSSKAFLEVLRAISEYTNRQFVPAVYLSHAGRNFCLGGDREYYLEAVSNGNHHAISASAELYRSILRMLASLRCIVVAVAYGSAQGGGFELLMAADMQVVWPGVKVGLPEIKSGLIAGMGGINYIGAIAGFPQAFRLNVSGALITSDEAASLGLLSHISQHPFAEAQGLVSSIPDHAAALSIRDTMNVWKYRLLARDINKWVGLVTDGGFSSHGNKIANDFAVIRQGQRAPSVDDPQLRSSHQVHALS